MTPLLVRGFGTADDPQVPTRPGADGDNQMIVPGSALHGAVRALHEAATSSCLRVLDTDYVPAYRRPADQTTQELRLALVVGLPEDGMGPELRLCQPGDPLKHRLHQDVLVRLHQENQPQGLRSGSRLAGFEPGKDTDPDRAVRLASDGDWVVFISDAGAREPRRPYRAAVRRLDGETVRVPAAAWMAFRHAVAGADDLRPGRLAKHPLTERFVEVEYRYKPKDAPQQVLTVGSRCLVRPDLFVGQPVWVRLAADGSVAALQLALVWRSPGAHTVADRAGRWAPCWDRSALCPACRLFGSADTRGDVDQQGRGLQHSYRGHVRFGDAVASAGVETVSVTLPPLGSPKPGAGQFYLVNGPTVVGNGGTPALREWGSAADLPTPRPLRGRKFYWHTEVPNGRLPRRGQAGAQHEGNTMVAAAVAYRIGSQFSATITFTDLDRGQLAALVVAACPRLCFGTDALMHLGGGRPLGYGSCACTIDSAGSWWSTARDRYQGRPPQALDEELLHTLADEFAATVPSRVRQALATVLTQNRVAERDVGYPPGPDPASGDEGGFAFWKQTSGLELAEAEGGRSGYPLTPLPELGQDPHLPAVSSAVPKPLHGPDTASGRRGRRGRR